MHASSCEAAPSIVASDRSAATMSRPRPTGSVRVLHVINGEHYSGAERVQDLLALGLGELDFEVGFACLKPGKFAVTREAQQAPVVQLEMSSRFDLRPAWRLANLARRERYGIIHTHTPRAAMIGRLAAALARVPLVHHVHSPTTNDSTRVRQDRWNARIERLSLNGVSAVIAVSQSLAGWARDQGIPPERINVVPNGVPTRGALAERDEPGDAWTLGTVALFRPRKGLEVLLEAITMLRRGGANVRLRAVGEFETAEYQAKIHALINDLALGDAIDWIGFTQDVPRELAKMDLFVLPSLFGEGLPMVVLEAMAAGVPVVASRVEGVPEAIRDGSEGLLAHANDPTDLARAISRFVRGGVSWTQIRRDAHVRQAERFSDRSMARGVAEVYREVL